MAPTRTKYTMSMISLVRQSSTITIQIFDNKKFKKRDQGLSLLPTALFPATLLLFFKGFWGLSVCQAQRLFRTPWMAVQVRYYGFVLISSYSSNSKMFSLRTYP